MDVSTATQPTTNRLVACASGCGYTSFGSPSQLWIAGWRVPLFAHSTWKRALCPSCLRSAHNG